MLPPKRTLLSVLSKNPTNSVNAFFFFFHVLFSCPQNSGTHSRHASVQEKRRSAVDKKQNKTIKHLPRRWGRKIREPAKPKTSRSAAARTQQQSPSSSSARNGTSVLSKQAANSAHKQTNPRNRGKKKTIQIKQAGSAKKTSGENAGTKRVTEGGPFSGSVVARTGQFAAHIWVKLDRCKVPPALAARPLAYPVISALPGSVGCTDLKPCQYVRHT